MQTVRVLFRRMSSRSWTGSEDPLEERYTAAEMLSLCVAIVAALSLLSLPIIFHFVKENRVRQQNNILYVYNYS